VQSGTALDQLSHANVDSPTGRDGRALNGFGLGRRRETVCPSVPLSWPGVLTVSPMVTLPARKIAQHRYGGTAARGSNMRSYWLMNQHGDDGPTALVETDGRMRISNVLRFGPSITELDDQQAIWDRVIGKVGPSLKPFVAASTIDEKGIEPHPDLVHAGTDAPPSGARSRTTQQGTGAGRTGGGKTHRGSRGER